MEIIHKNEFLLQQKRIIPSPIAWGLARTYLLVPNTWKFEASIAPRGRQQKAVPEEGRKLLTEAKDKRQADKRMV